MFKMISKIMTVAALSTALVTEQTGMAQAGNTNPKTDTAKTVVAIDKCKGCTFNFLAGPNNGPNNGNGNGDPTMDEKLKAEIGALRPVGSSHVSLRDFLIVRP